MAQTVSAETLPQLVECEINGKTRHSDTLTDPRDGKTYRTVRILNKIWMAENLDYEMGNSWYYKNNCGYGSEYGRLYDLETAVKISPPGWHLPTNREWRVMINALGGNRIAGKKLKSKTGWVGDSVDFHDYCRGDFNDNYNGTDDYGFSALPGGFRDEKGRFTGVGLHGCWWSAAKKDSDKAVYSWEIGRWDGVDLFRDAKSSYAFSVRCVRAA